MPPRFLTLDDLAAELTVSRSQAYALVRDGTVPAMQVGRRRHWRIERTRLEQWIQASHVSATGPVMEQAPFRPRPRRCNAG
jgi:excisionase family DNA binding protein